MDEADGRGHLLIVDGHNLLFQMFHGMPARIVGKGGRAIQAVVGFTGAFLKVVKRVRASHAVVLFDGEQGGSRVDEYGGYKGNRKDYTDVADDDNPFSQLADIKRVLDALGVRHYEIVERVEADDVVASYVAELKDRYTIYIMSTDTDFMQLVDRDVKVFVYRGERSVIYDADAVLGKFGVAPRHVADYKSLVGDPSDNIPGLRGIGPKTARKLIDRFGSVEDIIGHADRIEGRALQSIIAAGAEALRANVRLVTLSPRAATPFAIEALRLSDCEGRKTMEVLRGLDLA